ncbi:hypothetical protein PAPYR_3151 [Paratrimastix pyriformis]|uniref:Endonuclease/exonuclease/phosphatase domain-containing protein n=1 Tax=Paratrimastix pyriformis TaxID=342808 RepID=A0ABQ8UQH1_9EUKA|nr:hypothetical protein PAPYR_3151 [Paratrimastix pyriformis]
MPLLQLSFLFLFAFIIVASTIRLVVHCRLVSHARRHTQSHVPNPPCHPGQIYRADFRKDGTPSNLGNTTLKIISWNIERGYKYTDILRELQDAQADIVCLQEIDVNCARSGRRDVGQDLARALGMNYLFACEFEELESPIRTPQTQGGGVHGQGILTRFDLREAAALVHQVRPVDWERDGLARYHEPRKGGRVTAWADLATPMGVLRVYSAHLETFGGARPRAAQYAELHWHAAQEAGSGRLAGVIIAGDFNTLLHGIARLSPKYAAWWNLAEHLHHPGLTEAQWFDRAVVGPLSRRTGLTLRDPFEKGGKGGVTLTNYGGWYQGKLDWLLCSAACPRAAGPPDRTPRSTTVRVLEQAIGGGQASDHQWVAARIRIEPEPEAGHQAVRCPEPGSARAAN